MQTPLWRIAFDRRDNVIANGKVQVGRVKYEKGIWFGTFMWDGEFYERRGRSRKHLLSELRAAVGLVPQEVPVLTTVH